MVLLASLAGTAVAADLQTGIQQFEQKEFAQAESTLREVVAEDPTNADANYYLGQALIEQKKYKESEEFLKTAIDPKPEARVALGEAYLMQEKLDDAMRVLNEAEATQASNPKLWLNRGMISQKREKYADAAKQLDKALELDPRDGYAHYYMGLAQSKLKRTDLVIKHFELFLQLEPKAPEAARVRSLLRSL
jgi:tetratricopeptide (TPR) repeat protein